MPLERRTSVFPNAIRRYVLVAVIALCALAAVLIAWRGPAILLDLAGMIVSICF